MRFLLTLLFLSVLCTCARAQVGGSVDAEYANWCMVDSLPDGDVVRFTRLVNIATLDVKDIDPVAGVAYAVTGTLFTCEAYDLAQSLRDPLDDLYEDCQCIYTISQEDHRVSEIRGGLIQEYDIEFQEVVKRQCGNQMSSVVVHRDTLTKTTSLPVAFNLQYLFNLQVGDFVDKVNFRVYEDFDRISTITIDLNPNTVVSSYPGLVLNVADFQFDGTNAADMAAAYLDVLTEEFGSTSNSYSTSSSSGNVSIFIGVLHQPTFPYVTAPQPGDSDYSITTVPTRTIGFGLPGTITITRTNDYEEQCEVIFTEEIGGYIAYDPDFPLDLQPVLEPSSALRVSQSNPVAFCDVNPTVCAELVVDPVEIEGCVEVCSDVLNIAGHLPIADIDTTLQAGEFNSISIYVTQGPVGITIGGERINYPAGWSKEYSAAPGKLLSNSFGFSATGGEAIISFVR